MDDFHKFPDHFPTMKFLLDRPFLEVIFEVQIPSDCLTSLKNCGIITRYKRRQNQDSSRAIYCSNIFPHLLDTLKFKTNIFTRLFTHRFQKFIMNNFKKDHRVFMMSCVAALTLGGKWKIHDKDSINSSFPKFLKLIKKLGAKIN